MGEASWPLSLLLSLYARLYWLFGLPDIVARYIAKGIIPPGSQRTLAVGAVAASIIPGVVVALYCHSWSFFSWPISIGAALLVPWTTATVIGRGGVVLGHHAYRKLTASQLVGGIFRLLAPPLTLIFLVDDPTENMGLAVVLSYIVAASIPIFLVSAIRRARRSRPPSHTAVTRIPDCLACLCGLADLHVLRSVGAIRSCFARRFVDTQSAPALPRLPRLLRVDLVKSCWQGPLNRRISTRFQQ